MEHRITDDGEEFYPWGGSTDNNTEKSRAEKARPTSSGIYSMVARLASFRRNPRGPAQGWSRYG